MKNKVKSATVERQIAQRIQAALNNVAIIKDGKAVTVRVKSVRALFGGHQ